MDIAPIQERINKLKKVSVAALSIYLTIYYAFILFLNQDYSVIASDLMSPVGIIISLIILYYAIHLSSEKKPRWILIVLFWGAAAYLLGDLQNAYDELVQGSRPFAAACDTYYTISAFLVLIGFFLYVPQKSKTSAMRSGFDVFIMMIIYLSLESKYILMPVMNDRTLSAIEKFSSLVYPFFDAGLVMAMLLVFFNDGDDKRFYKSKLMVVIAGIWLFADQVFSIQTINGNYQSGSWLDPLWAASFIGLAIVGLLSAEFYLFPPESINNTVQKRKEGIISKNTFITYGIMITFMVMWSLNYYKQEPLSIGGITILFLLIIRQYFSLQENKNLMQSLIQSNEDLQDAKSRIEYELRTDYLTRLFNRRYIDGAIAELQKSADVNSSPFSVLVLDIDHFKNVNDRYGHSTGDQILKQIAEIIGKNIHKDDIAARWGGEEFIIILPDTCEKLAYRVGERIRREIEQWYFKSENVQGRIQISVSVGIAEVNRAEHDFSKVLIRADQGMYEAKYAGRNRTVVKRAS